MYKESSLFIYEQLSKTNEDKHLCLTSAFYPKDENLLQEIKKMEQEYSTDEQKVYYLNQQIILLQKISFYFFIIYYIVLCIFIYSFIYGNITYSRNIII